MNTILSVKIFSIARLGLVKDGKMGASLSRSSRIRRALLWTGAAEKMAARFALDLVN